MLTWRVWMCHRSSLAPWCTRTSFWEDGDRLGVVLTLVASWLIHDISGAKKWDFFSLNGAKAFSLSSFRWRTQKETIIQGSMSCDNGSHSWGPSQAPQLPVESTENLRERMKGEEDVCQYGATYKPPVFANKLENSVSFNYCPVHLQTADLSLCLSPWDTDSRRRRLRALLVLFLSVTVIYIGWTKSYP